MTCRIQDLTLHLLVLICGLTLAAPGRAALPHESLPSIPEKVVSSLLGPVCGCASDREALIEHRDAILAAPSLTQARDLALEKTRQARRALSFARRLAPFGEDLERTHAELVEYEGRVARAGTNQEVAEQFEGLVQLASLDAPGATLYDVDIDIDTDGHHRCHYTTGEVIAIVLGLILGIIPGLILLILLC